MAEIQAALNTAAGTSGLDEAGAANALAGTIGLELVGALNVAAGNTVGSYKELEGVLNQLAGTTGIDINGASSLVTVRSLLTELAAFLTTEAGDLLVQET